MLPRLPRRGMDGMAALELCRRLVGAEGLRSHGFQQRSYLELPFDGHGELCEEYAVPKLLVLDGDTLWRKGARLHVLWIDAGFNEDEPGRCRVIPAGVLRGDGCSKERREQSQTMKS